MIRTWCSALVVVAWVGSAVPAEDFTQWNHSRDIVINTGSSGYAVSGALHCFPYLVRLSKADFDFGQAAAHGEDIRFVRSGADSSLPHEIEVWDTSLGRAAVWVGIDTIRGNDSTQAITMYWGNPESADRSNGTRVFTNENGFTGVWHLGEDGDSSAGAFTDAGANAHHGSGTLLTSASRVEGPIGYGQNFRGEQSIYIPPLELNSNTVTMSAWIKISGPQVRLVSPLFSRSDESMASGMSITGNDVFYHWAGAYYEWSTGLVVPSYRYAFMALVVTPDSATAYLGVDGEFSSAVNIAAHELEAFASALFIGQDPFYDTRYFKGVIDEAVISNVSRTTDWLRLCYLNQRFTAETAPVIRYPMDLLTLYVGVDSVIAPAVSGIVDSVTIEPALPAPLVFDGASGTISGHLRDTMSAGTFHVRASNAAGWSVDTIVIAGDVSAGVRSRIAADISRLPAVLGLSGGLRSAIRFRIPPSAVAGVTRLSLYDLEGRRIWSRTIGESRMRAGINSIVVDGASFPIGGGYLAVVEVCVAARWYTAARTVVVAAVR